MLALKLWIAESSEDEAMALHSAIALGASINVVVDDTVYGRIHIIESETERG
jgi:hypothetical protein